MHRGVSVIGQKLALYNYVDVLVSVLSGVSLAVIIHDETQSTLFNTEIIERFLFG